MNRDGSGQRRLTRGREAIGPAWSPDGGTIYFSSYIVQRDAHGGFEGYAWALFRMQKSGGDVRRLTRPEPTDHGTCDSRPAPSPDGRVIAYGSIGDCDRGSDASIEAVDVSGRAVGLAPFAVGAGFDPAWSPAGRHLAFASVSDLGTGTGIAVASADGAAPRRLYRRGPASGPAWSPDGNWLAFSTNGNVWLVRFDGSGLRRVLRTALWRSNPAWLPTRRQPR
jgi:Tol biopolymer transport system component